MPLHHGELFAGYVIQRLLGTGGMGEVYLAQHPRLPRHDALKVLSADASNDEEFRARFQREAELAATLWHPHIVGVLDRGEFNGRLWISMDFVDGTDAGRLIRDHPTGMRLPDVEELVAAVADALDFGHERNLLHRDVKPENILVATSDENRRRVLLTDFGIARRIDDVNNLTEANVAMGTIDYIAPEQLLGRTVDGRADQYGLAATTFHLLTGTPPFKDSNRAVVISHHLSTPPPRLSDRRPDLAHLDEVLARALAKNPDERYASCLEFARALGAAAPAPDARPASTQRLKQVAIRGTARGVQHAAGVLSFHLVPDEPIDGRQGPVAVGMPTELAEGGLADGDEVEVSGVWDGDTVDADRIVKTTPAPPPKAPKAPRVREARRGGVPGKALAALGVVVAVVLAATLYVTDGFGLWAPAAEPIVTAERATVFSPNGSPDNPDQADNAIDGDPNSAWSTVTYSDPVPFPTYIEGMGLMLHLREPIAVAAVSLDVPSTGTAIQIRASSTESPAALSDTTELTPSTPLQPGRNTITVTTSTKTDNVLLWITTLGTTDGQSRTAISDVTVQAAG